LRAKTRRAIGKKSTPTVAIVDSQSIRTAEGGEQRGYDSAKKITGRKRHLAVDTLGLLLAVVVHAADCQDQDGAKWVLEKLGEQLKILRLQKKETFDTLSEKTGIDRSVLNKFEKGLRVPNQLQMGAIEKALKVRHRELRTLWLATRIMKEIGDEEDALEALKVAESFFTYENKKDRVLQDLIKEADQLKKKLDKKRPLPKAQLRNLMNAFKIERQSFFQLFQAQIGCIFLSV